MPNGWEWAILVLIAVLLIGGARLSGVSRDTGRGVSEFKGELEADSGGPVVPQSPTSPSAVAEISEESATPASPVEAQAATDTGADPVAAAEND